jgi:predicted membrane channel-forming protein YqfA (hemolysin III family)
MNLTAVISNLMGTAFSFLCVAFFLYQGVMAIIYFLSPKENKKRPTLALFFLGVLLMCGCIFFMLFVLDYAEIL